MNPNALVFMFGAISSAMVGLVFAYKWLADGRREHDLYWAWGHLAFGAAIFLAAAHYYVFQDSFFGIAAVGLFWTYAALMIRANFAYLGRTRLMRPLMALCAACALWSLVLGLYRIEVGLVIFAPIAAALTLWTGWILRNMPRIGRAALTVFALRAAVVVVRPAFADSPYLFEYSVVSFTLAFLTGATLLTGSLLKSRDALLASEIELKDSYRLLEEQAIRLERLSMDYAKALQHAERASRAKDAFISNMNHEFRTPLNAVLGFSELIKLEAERSDSGRILEYASYAHEGGKAMLRNVQRILDFVSLDSGEREIARLPFCPAEAIRAEIAMLAEIATSKHVVINELLDQAPQIWPGDERAFRTVVDELLRNALTAAPDASTVTVEVSAENNGLTLQIADSGPGLTDEFLKTVGERFNIRQDVLHRGGLVQGVGLGLCIAGLYARLMGGTLSLNRNPPTGTVARLIIAAA
jgi:signal transduction histidine kinase